MDDYSWGQGLRDAFQGLGWGSMFAASAQNPALQPGLAQTFLQLNNQPVQFAEQRRQEIGSLLLHSAAKGNIPWDQVMPALEKLGYNTRGISGLQYQPNPLEAAHMANWFSLEKRRLALMEHAAESERNTSAAIGTATEYMDRKRLTRLGITDYPEGSTPGAPPGTAAKAQATAEAQARGEVPLSATPAPGAQVDPTSGAIVRPLTPTPPIQTYGLRAPAPAAAAAAPAPVSAGAQAEAPGPAEAPTAPAPGEAEASAEAQPLSEGEQQLESELTSAFGETPTLDQQGNPVVNGVPVKVTDYNPLQTSADMEQEAIDRREAAREVLKSHPNTQARLYATSLMKEAAEFERERAKRQAEELGWAREERLRAKEALKQKAAEDLTNDKEGIHQLAMDWLRNGTQPRGYGNLGTAQRILVNNERVRIAKAMGLTPEEVSNLPNDLKMKNKAVARLTDWAASVGRNQKELEKDLDRVIETARELPLTKLAIVNKGIVAGELQYNDPTMNRYAVLVQTVMNKYGRIMSGPTSNAMIPVEAMKHSRDLVGTGQNVPAWLEIKRAMLMDSNNTLSSTNEMRDSMRKSMGLPPERVSPFKETPVGPPVKIQTSTQKVPPLTNSRGWTLHQDAQGNYGYIGPKGEVEEVK